MKTKFKDLVKKAPWIWALLGSLIAWIGISILTSQLNIQGFLSNAGLASLLAIVAIGQMFAVASGDGGIDLSIPYVITLSAFISFGLINGSNSRFLIGIAAIVGLGLLVGLLNSAAIIVFKIPPIIATMAMGFMINSVILIYSEGFNSYSTSSILAFIANKSIAGIPVILIFAVLAVIVVWFVLNKLTYGRSIMAVGQNRLAAYLSGIKVNKTIIIAYMVSGLFAAISGALIGARVNGAFLDLGQPYMLQSVGAVVIGGTLASGGKATVAGTALGSLFLILLVTLMVVTHLPIGVQYIIEGIVLILVLAIGGEQKEGD